MNLTDSKAGYFLRFETFAINRMVPASVQEQDSLSYWRVRVLFTIIFTGLCIGIMTLVTSIVLAIQENLWGLLFFALFAWLMGMGLLLITGLRYELRAMITLVIIYFMGVAVVVFIGPLSGGPIWLFAFAVFAGILLGSKTAVIALIINAVTLTVLGWSLSSGLFGQTFPFFSSTERMIGAGANFMLLNTITALSVAVLVKGLVSTHKKEKNLVSSLKKEQKRLVDIKNKLESEIEDRRQVENALRESENKLNIIFEAAPDAYYISDYKGIFITGNKAAEALVGCPREAFIGKNFSEAGFFSTDEVEKATKRLNENINGKSPGPNEYTLKRKDGTTVTVEIIAHPVKINGNGMLLGIARDITTRREAEAKQAQLLAAIEQAAETIVISDADGTIRYANPAFERISGYTPEEVIGKNSRILKSVEHDASFYRQMWQTITAGDTWRGRFINRKKDGTLYTETASISSVLDNAGKMMSYVAVKRDITDEIKIEEQLHQAQKMDAIGTLAGGIAHQFNNALYAITGNIDLLEMDFAGDEAVGNYTGEMKTSAHRMTQLTAQLLAYARGGKYQAKTISLRNFVQKTLPLVRHTIDSDIDVDAGLTWDNLTVNADLTQMQMLLSALLTNASEAMAGKGCIHVACQKMIMTDDAIKAFPALTPGDYACLTVTDAGKGMDEETKNRIFEPFFTTQFEGRGLGLAAVYGIVKNHDGAISVDSWLGRGTTVKIYLPLIESARTGLSDAQTPVKEKAKPQWTKDTGTILVIEDEAPVRAVTRAILEKLGYRVLEAQSGQEAVDVVNTFDDRIDLAMLDIVMPDMKGNAVYPLLKKARPDLKVLVCSGYAIDGPARELLDAGAEDFIQKPFMVAELSEKLKKMIGRLAYPVRLHVPDCRLQATGN